MFYVRFCLSVGFVHGTYRLFDSKIFTRMCLSVGPNVCVLRPSLFLVLCLCVYVYVFHFFFLKFIYWEVCFTWDFVCQWVLCTGPTTSLIAKFSLECVCQWVPNVCVLRPFLFLVLRLCVYVFLFSFFFNLFIKKCVLREILSVSGSCARNLLSLW